MATEYQRYHLEICSNLGNLERQKLNSLLENLTAEDICWLKNRDDGLALNNLGYLYRHGLGVERDYTKAREYYERAVEEDNDPDALNNLIRLPGCDNIYFVQLYQRIRNKTILNHLRDKVSATTLYLLSGELTTGKDVFHLKRRIDELSREDECPICYERRALIPRACLHYYCRDCYCLVDCQGQNCAICQQ